MISAISVKDRLKKQAIEEKKIRATTDIDLLAQCISNDIEEMKKVDTSLAKRVRIAQKCRYKCRYK